MMNTTTESHSASQAAAQLASIRELVAALKHANAHANDSTSTLDGDTMVDEARQAIIDDALEVCVRDPWRAPGQTDSEGPTEFKILLCTGGPAVRIIGDLNEHGEAESARIEHQDWGTPWTEHRITAEEEADVLAYCAEFCFSE